MHELAVFSYLMPLAIQAGLFNLVSTRHDYLEKPLIRWTRLCLLPITLSTILSNLISVKDRTHIAPFTKLCIGSMFASQALKSMLFTFNQPAPPDSIEAKNCLCLILSDIHIIIRPDQRCLANPWTWRWPKNHDVHSSTDVSKQPKFELGPNHSMHSDMSFLLRTLRRMLIHHVCGVVALICWRSVDNEALIDQLSLGPLVEKYKFEITVFCCGNFIWTNLDLSGCVLRILFSPSKWSTDHYHHYCRQFLRICHYWKRSIRSIWTKLAPSYSKKLHCKPKALASFIKNLILEAGAVPFTSFLVWVFGTGKLHPKALRLAGILAAFTISGLIHEAGKRGLRENDQSAYQLSTSTTFSGGRPFPSGVWTAGPIDPKFKTTIFFISQGVGVCLENTFKTFSGRKVNGILGRIWTFSWLIYFATPMVAIWFVSLAASSQYLKPKITEKFKTTSFDQDGLFRRVDELGFLRIILTPLIVPRLLLLSA
ncbi:hypothetical protein PSHT_06977 [Puccinia striiformis]|uniref:Wax synthase domain-containing protein n=1 Tax=Puccinia striiformis TaxID=27350 RepID=A0A2S4W1C1_9BASI|nr:hypothetical protein PSHT_06977 [Puccinia striiformis]